MISEETKIKLAAQDRLHVRFYFVFVGLFVLSLILLTYFLNDSRGVLWNRYVQVLSLMVIAYTWYVFILLFFNEYKAASQDEKDEYRGEKMAVVIPCYNEKPDLLERCIRS